MYDHAFIKIYEIFLKYSILWYFMCRFINLSKQHVNCMLKHTKFRSHLIHFFAITLKAPNLCFITAKFFMFKATMHINKNLVSVFLLKTKLSDAGKSLYKQGRIQGVLGGPGPPDHQKWGPSTKILQNWGPRMAVLGPKIIIFFENFSLASLGINSWLLIISIFSRLATLAIVLCIYVFMHHFILLSLAQISCTL